MKKLFLLGCLLLSACGQQQDYKATIKVGTISGPETALMETAKEVAAKKFQLNIEIVEFSDYITPNTALNDGAIDANVYQHQPFLDAAIKMHQYPFVSIGKTFIYPMAIYSKKLPSLDVCPEKATVAIPNDPSNEARALILLDDTGLIRLKKHNDVNATVLDISENPKQLDIKPLDAAQLPRALDDVDYAVINTNYAFTADLLPSQNGLARENKNSPYANLIVVKKENESKTELQQLVKALHSEEVKQQAKNLFKGEAIPAW